MKKPTKIPADFGTVVLTLKGGESAILTLEDKVVAVFRPSSKKATKVRVSAPMQIAIWRTTIIEDEHDRRPHQTS
jgi:sRNA-binding carbon storage regulator CsrA